MIDQDSTQGVWAVENLTLVPAGEWSIRVEVLVGDFESWPSRERSAWIDRERAPGRETPIAWGAGGRGGGGELSGSLRFWKFLALGSLALAAALVAVVVYMSGWLQTTRQSESPAAQPLQHQHQMTPPPAATQPPETTEMPADLQLGFGLYVLHCSGCHGSRIEGQPNWQAALPDGRMPAPPLNATGHIQHHAESELFRIVKQGMASVNGGKPTNMPAFAGVLTDDQIRSVLAFIKSSP